MDRLLDETRTGPVYLRQPPLADMVVEALRYNATVLAHYRLWSYVVMPNHVHLLATPAVPIPKMTRSLKGITAKRANLMLGLTGRPFWQEESYDHVIRNEREFEKIRDYIEQKYRTCGTGGQGRGVSVVKRGWGDRRSPADQGVRPTIGIR